MKSKVMTVQPANCSQEDDLVGRKGGIWLWCVPTLALVLGLSWNAARPWLWIPALLIMGAGCVVNARRCGRLHCYATGPIFLLAAVYVILAEVHVVPLSPNCFRSCSFGSRGAGLLGGIAFGAVRRQELNRSLPHGELVDVESAQ